MILTLRTDKPESEIGLFDGNKRLAHEAWHAHRQLAETIHQKIKEILSSQGKSLHDITGIVIYKGPGSFTGLRIGISVANALAYSLNIPIAGTSGDDWLKDGLVKLQAGKGGAAVVPEYGSAANITQPRK